MYVHRKRQTCEIAMCKEQTRRTAKHLHQTLYCTVTSHCQLIQLLSMNDDNKGPKRGRNSIDHTSCKFLFTFHKCGILLYLPSLLSYLPCLPTYPRCVLTYLNFLPNCVRLPVVASMWQYASFPGYSTTIIGRSFIDCLWQNKLVCMVSVALMLVYFWFEVGTCWIHG